VHYRYESEERKESKSDVLSSSTIFFLSLSFSLIEERERERREKREERKRREREMRRP